MKVNWNLVVDVVVALVGVYVLMNGIWMKSTGKTSSLLATPEELKKCKHPEKIRNLVKLQSKADILQRNRLTNYSPRRNQTTCF